MAIGPLKYNKNKQCYCELACCDYTEVRETQPPLLIQAAKSGWIIGVVSALD